MKKVFLFYLVLVLHNGLYCINDTCILQRLEKAVVQVFSTNARHDIFRPFNLAKQSVSVGSAFFLDPLLVGQEGYLLTNFHVIKNACVIEIQLPFPECGKKRFESEVVSVYPERDLALIKLTQQSFKKLKNLIGDLPFLSFGDSLSLRRGDSVIAIGYPLGQEGIKITRGIISGQERLTPEGALFLQIDAAVNRGNSGGPSLDAQGNVIGINTCGPHPAFYPGVQNIAYLIPIHDVYGLLPVMMEQKYLHSPFWGVRLSIGSTTISRLFEAPKNVGIYVAAVHGEGILAQHGLDAGCLITAINGNEVDHFGGVKAPWLREKISIIDFLNMPENPKNICLEIAGESGKKYITLNLNYRDILGENSAIWPRNIYPCYDPNALDYECIGGFVFMNCSENHLRHFASNLIDAAWEYAADPTKGIKTRNVEKNGAVIISAILPNTLAARARSFEPGYIVSYINGEQINTLADVRRALKLSCSTGLVLVQSNNGALQAHLLKDILAREKALLKEYGYTPSVLITS